MAPIVVVVGIGLAAAYIPLQVLVWRTLRGVWFSVGLIAPLVPLIACAVGLWRDSNLWPFWGIGALPVSTAILTVLWLVHRFASPVLHGAKRKPTSSKRP